MSSSSRSPTPTRTKEIRPSEVDITTLITEVQCRPPLWDRKSRKYKDKLMKARLWEDVSKEIVSNWSELRSQDRRDVCAGIQKKWRNMRDSFFRELAIKNKEATGQTYKKKRKYIHFDALSFLSSQPIIRKKLSVDDYEEESSSINTDRIDQLDHSRKRKRDDSQNINPIDIDVPSENSRYDEDVSFSEMLVPMLKKLNDDQKHFAKVKILNVLHKAKSYVKDDFSD